MENTYTIKELRAELKSAGFKLKTSRYSEFIAGDIIDARGVRLGQIMTRDDYDAFKAAIDIREKFKGRVFDGMTRVVI